MKPPIGEGKEKKGGAGESNERSGDETHRISERVCVGNTLIVVGEVGWHFIG